MWRTRMVESILVGEVAGLATEEDGQRSPGSGLQARQYSAANAGTSSPAMVNSSSDFFTNTSVVRSVGSS